MMPEISLNILDVAENSTRADASLVQITVDVQPDADRLTVIITDDGCGMTKEQVGTGHRPLLHQPHHKKGRPGCSVFKFAAESTGGSFSIESEPGKGTTVTAIFTLNHIDRMPLGDMTATIHTPDPGPPGHRFSLRLPLQRKGIFPGYPRNARHFRRRSF